MPSIAVVMPYAPGLSVNHYLGRWADGGYYVKPAVKAWKEELTIKVRNQTHLRGLKPTAPIIITLKAYYPDGRSITDGQNASKVICDAIEDAWIRPDGLGPLINDRDFRFRDEGYEVGHAEARLEITIEW